MIIGSVKELKTAERRVGLTPSTSKQYIDAGHRVIVEKGLGVASGFSDKDYKLAGAEILEKKEAIWKQADMIVKVKEPIKEEYGLMRENQTIFTYFHLAANKELTSALIDNKVNAVAYETVEDKAGSLVLLKPMSELAGKLAILEGSKYLQSHYGGKGILLSASSNVNGANVLIIGAGSVGYNALLEAFHLNANITVLVRSEKSKKRLLKEFENKIKVMINNKENLENALKTADLIVSSVLSVGAKAEKLIKKEHLKLIEKGSVFVDVAIDQGGSSEMSRPTTHLNPIYNVDGVIFYCVANMAGSIPKTASIALANKTVDYGLKIANKGLEKAVLEDQGLRKGINIYKGSLVNKAVAKALNLKSFSLKIN